MYRNYLFDKWESVFKYFKDKDFSGEKESFTLVEALLTLVVLGIVTAITIPMLISAKDKREWISALNKSYSTISEGFKQSETLHDKCRLWTEENFIKNFMDGFRVETVCEDNDCVPEVKYLNGETASLPVSAKSFVLSDGQIITLNLTDLGCTSSLGNLEGLCGTVYIDVNGAKGPNTWGKDYFGFYVSQNGIVPFGAQKLDKINNNYTWMTNGCHGEETKCLEYLSCADANSIEEICGKCGGEFNAQTYAATYSFVDSTYKVTGYQAATYKDVMGDINHPAYCNGYTHRCSKICTQRSRYGDCAYYQTSCTDVCNYVAAYTSHGVTGYAVNTYKTLYGIHVEAYYQLGWTLKEAECVGSIPEQVCTKEDYVSYWDCWHDRNSGEPYVNDCNAQNTASKTSCDFKEVDALEDCNLEGKGTSCGAWVLVNGQMQYLDGKEISW